MATTPNREFQMRITKKSKRVMKNGKTHPWAVHWGTSKQCAEEKERSEAIVPFHATMGVKK